MTPEDAVVCLCTRQRFSEAHRKALETLGQDCALRWDAIFGTANEHGVSPLVYSNLQRADLDIPTQVLDKLKSAYIHNVFVKKGSNAILKRVVDLFDAHGIALMLVKGEALNLTVYHRPWYTISLDIDVVLKAHEDDLSEDQRQHIIGALNALNEERSPFKEHIEYDYYIHHDVNLNGILTIDAERIWDEARPIEFDGRRVHIMAPEDTLIAASVQNCRKRFFRLKSACDIAEIVSHYPDMAWDVLVRKAHDYRCNTIVYTAFLVTQALLGCDLPQGLLSELGVNSIRAAAIERLVRALHRNFTLDTLMNRSESSLLGREASWPLLLTYATYRVDQLIPKLSEIYQTSRRRDPTQ